MWFLIWGSPVPLSITLMMMMSQLSHNLFGISLYLKCILLWDHLGFIVLYLPSYSHTHTNSNTCSYPVLNIQTHTVPNDVLDIRVDMCMWIPAARMSTQHETHTKVTLPLVMLFSFILFSVISLYDCRRRLNNNDLSVLEATGAFKGLSQLKKM